MPTGCGAYKVKFGARLEFPLSHMVANSRRFWKPTVAAARALSLSPDPFLFPHSISL